jgi:UDP-glucose 4-epimerase
MTVLITGGMGFIGLHTVEAFLNAGENVVATYRETWRVPSFLAAHMGDRLNFEQVDIGEPGALLALANKHHVDGIVHMAIHGTAQTDPGDDLRANMDKLSLILDTALISGVRRISLASSSAPYFGVPEGPFREDQPLPMDSVISPEAFKKAWEILALNYAKTAGIDLVNMRLSGVYGPMYASMRNLPSRLIAAAVQGNAPDFSPAFGGVPFADDAQDLTFVKDIARGIVLVHNAESLAHRTYNIGSGRATSNAEFLDAVKQVKPSFDTTLEPGRSPRFKPNAYDDITRIQSELGYAPQFTAQTAIAAYVAWLEAGNAQ